MTDMNDTPQCPHCSSENHPGGFTSGMLMGAIIGAAAVYVVASPEGRKKAKKLLEEGQKLAEELEQKTHEAKKTIEESVKNPEKHTTVESVASQLKKKFFKKKGRSLSNLW